MHRVLVIMSQFKAGGFETQTRGFCRALTQFGYEVYVASPPSTTLHMLSPHVMEIYTGTDVADFCRRREIEWVHCHPFVGPSVARACGLPFVVHKHSPHMPVRDWDLAPDSMAVVAVSPEVAESVPETERPVWIVPNGVDHSTFYGAKRDRDGAWALVARLDADKYAGAVSALSQFARMRKRGLKPDVHVYGAGQRLAALKTMCHTSRYDEWVSFRGHHEHMADELRNNYAGVAGMGRVVLEGAALGLPVLLVGYDGVKGIIDHVDLPRLAYRNFSGRKEPNVTPETFSEQIERVYCEYDPAPLERWVVKHADEDAVWWDYLQHVKEAA